MQSRHARFHKAVFSGICTSLITMVTQCLCETSTNAEWSSEDCTLANQMVRKCGTTHQFANLNHLYLRCPTASPAAPEPGLVLWTPPYIIQNDLLPLLPNDYFLTNMVIIFQKDRIKIVLVYHWRQM